MKKFIVLLAAATMVFASCSLDKEIQTNNGIAINFTSEVGTKATASVTTANMTYFYSTALDKDGGKYFVNQLFEKQTTGAYTSNPEYYWPGDGSILKFFCYSTSGDKNNMCVPTPDFISGSYVMKNVEPNKDDVSKQVDFIYGYTQGTKENETTGLSVQMRHGFTQVNLKAKNTNAGYIYTITGVKIANITSKGDFTFPTAADIRGTWAPASDSKTDYTITYTAAPVTLTETPKDLMGENGNFVVIPQQLNPWLPLTDQANTNNGAYLAVEIDLKTVAGAQVYKGWASAMIGEKWEEGKVYSYILDFSKGAGRVDPKTPGTPGNPGEEILGGPIEFNVIEIDEWTNVGSSNIDM